MTTRRDCLFGGVAAALVGCGPARAAADPVAVLYAGSLVSLMERGIGPAFARATGGRFEGYPGGSKALAMQIKGHLRRADVFVSASPTADDALTGGANGDLVRWYVRFAQSPLVIGYAPSSRFAGLFRSHPWYEVLAMPGIRIGRTDPALDPKGALTVALMRHAEEVTHRPGLAEAVLGAPDDPAEVRPEPDLIGRLQSGQIDAGFFYSTEVHDLRIPSVALPPDVALAAHYTATVPTDAADPEAGARFVAFLLGRTASGIMRAHGLDTVTPTASDPAAVPASIRLAIAASR